MAKTRLNTRVDSPLDRACRMLAAYQETSYTKFVEDALEQYLMNWCLGEGYVGFADTLDRVRHGQEPQDEGP